MSTKRKWNGGRIVAVALALAVSMLLVAGIAEAYPDPLPPITVASISTGSSNSFSHTVPAGSDRLLVVSVMTGSEQSTTSVTYNSNPMTPAVAADYSSDGSQVSVFYQLLGSGSAITANVSISFTGSNPNPSVGLAYNYNGVDQSSPIGVTASNTAANCSSGSGVSVSMSGMDRSSVIHAAISQDNNSGDGDIFSSNNVSEVWDDDTSTGNDLSYWAGYSLVDTNGERVVGADADNGEDCALAAMEIKASVTPAYNPDLPAACGLDFTLILDASGSIGTTDQQAVRDASSAFLNAMVNTGSKVAVVEFASSAVTRYGWMPLNSANLTTLEDYLDNTYHNGDVGNWTNWQAAMLATYAINAGGPVADMVVFMTDGDPTAYNDSNGNPLTGQSERLAMLHAFGPADQVRGQGSHLFGIGVGLTTGDQKGRLSAATGPDEYPTPWSNFAQGDYTTTADFDQLADALQDIAFSLCGNSLTVTKYVDDGFEQVPVPDFPLTATVNVTGGNPANGYDWVQPVQGPAGNQDNLGQTQGGNTFDDGTFIWQWTPNEVTWPSEIDFSELSVDLTPQTPVDCQRFSLGDDAPTPFQIAGGQPWNVEFTTADIVTCDLINSGTFDWGDAPDSYGTLGTNSGPRHLAYTGDPIIGVLRDTESNGQPNAGATGDDTNGLADEDGLSIPAGSNWSDQQGEMDVVITNGPACLNAWVDFNNDSNTVDPDGDFNDAGEHVLVNYNAVNGVNNTTFPLPLDAANGATLYMRFRVTPMGTGACGVNSAVNYLYADGLATPNNQAFGGEIQDMVVTFSPTAVTLSSQSAAAGATWVAGVVVALAAMGLLAATVALGRRSRSAR